MPETSVRLDSIMPLIRERLAAGESVQFTPRGTSMTPMILGGRDQVVLSPLPAQLRKYDLPLFQRDNGQYVLHRIVKTGDTYTCIGDNQFEYETGVRGDQMIAVATAFVRKGKLRQVNTVSHKLYCRLWCGSRSLRHFCLIGQYRVKQFLGLRPKKDSHP